jgi:hypothetical protein
MALQISTRLENGITLNEAYVKVTEVSIRISGAVDDKCVHITVGIYADALSREEGYNSVMYKTYSTTNQAEYTNYFGNEVLNQLEVNPTSQAYEFLKTLPGFTNFTNV